MIAAFQRAEAENVFRSLAILVAFAVLAVVVRLVWSKWIRFFTQRTKNTLDDAVMGALHRPVSLSILLVGLYLALQALRIWSDSQRQVLSNVAAAVAVVVLVYAGLRVFNAACQWYVEEMAAAPSKARLGRQQVATGRKIVNLVVLSVGILVVLNQLGVKVGPLLAGLGIGGLAVALALQDTLSNLFAGFSVVLDRPIAVGDFVKLESGEEGFVEEIGWRNTKIRMWANNVVIIPNAKLVQSVITNYYLPRQEMSVYISCGVSYDSDLEKVERVCIEVGKEVMSRVPGSATDWTPVVRFKEFGDFSINFIVVLRVKDFGSQYALHHEYVKALHRRFAEEGIEIPFPIQTVIMRRPRPADAQRQTGRPHAVRPPEIARRPESAGDAPGGEE